MLDSRGRTVLSTCLALTLAAGVIVAVAGCSKSGQDTAAAPGAAAGQAAQPGQPGPSDQPGQPGQPAPAQPRPAAQPAPVPAPPPPPPPRKFTLAAGAILAVRTNYTLSTDTHAAGDKFVASLAEPIVDGDWVVAKEGAEVDGLVVAATKGGKVKGTAQLEIAVTGLTLADGQHVAVATTVDAAKAASSKGNDAAKIGITAGIGTAIGAIAGGGKGAAIGAAAGGAGGTALVLGTRGKPAQIPARTLLNFKVTSPVDIVEKK
jgi:hypothetical protein